MKWLAVMAVAILGCLPPAEAQTPAAPRPAGVSPPFRRATDKPVGWTSEIDSFLKRLLATYREADSYRDHGRVRIAQKAGRVTTTTEMPMEIAFRRPNLLALDAGHYTAVCDGTNLFFTMETARQFTATRAPERLERKHLAGGPAGGGIEQGQPDVLDFLVLPDAGESFLAQVTRIGWGGDTNLGGVACRGLNYETTQGARVTMWVDPKRTLLMGVEGDAGLGEAEERTSFSYDLGVVELNGKLNPSRFAFKPPAGFRRVRAIGGADPFTDPAQGPSPEHREAEGAHLLGRPSPSIAGKDLAGVEFTDTELKGKVVLLFFWSLAGGEHCLRAIPMAQQVSERFRARAEVRVLGVSADADNSEVVAQLLERKQARFRTLLDEGMKTQTGFGLAGVPTFVIIGPDGIVKWARLGAPPGLTEELVKEMEKLLPAAGP